MARVIVHDRRDTVVMLSGMEATAVDYREGRYQVEMTGGGRTIIVQLSRLEMIGLSAKIRSEIADVEEREAWQGDEVRGQQSEDSASSLAHRLSVARRAAVR